MKKWLNRTDIRIGIGWIIATTSLLLFGYFRGVGVTWGLNVTGVNTLGGAIIHFLFYWTVVYSVAIILFIRAWRKSKSN